MLSADTSDSSLSPIRVPRRERVVSIDGQEGGFPGLGELSSLLHELDCVHLVPGRTLQPPGNDDLRRALPPVKYPAVRNVWASCAPGLVPAGGGAFLENDADLSRRSVQVLHESAKNALALGVNRIVVDLDRRESSGVASPGLWMPRELGGLGAPPATSGELPERSADLLCRSLHAVLREQPQIRLCLCPPHRVGSPFRPEILRWVLDDLGSRVGYWHDTGRVLRWSREGGPEEGAWLAMLASRCEGVDLTDCVDVTDDLPAGSGDVDYRPLREALGSQTLFVVRAGLVSSTAHWKSAFDHLSSVGLFRGTKPSGKL